MEKTPSPWTIVLTGWLGFMFATAVAALIPSVQLAVAPILCHAPYGHGVVRVHGYSYGTTSGYTIFLRCANAQHQERGTSVFAVVGLLWVYGWVGALAIRGAYYWGKVAITKSVDTYWRRRLPPPPVRPRPAATAKSLLGATAPAATAAAAPARGSPALIPRRPDPVEQLARLADLRDRGVLTDEEFASEKARILAG
jgi:Short C-terminal domain